MVHRISPPVAPLLLCLAMTLLVTAVPLAAQAARPETAEELVRRVDELYRSETSRALVEMQVVTPNWQRTLRMRVWSRGMTDTFIRVLEPKKEAGFATLRIGNEMWNYLPKIAKVLKVPPSMMMSSWMGSDLTNDDLVKEFTFVDSYRFALTEPESAEPGVAYVKCVPKEGLPIVWGSVVLAIRKEGLIPLWEKYYDDRGNLARTITFSDVRTFGRRRIPATMELVPEGKPGHRTVLRYLEADFDIHLQPDIFSLRNLHGGL
jgi:outer membrane lipoprotein-sorting protein